MVDQLVALRAEVIRLRPEAVEGVAAVERASLRASITDDLAYSLRALPGNKDCWPIAIGRCRLRWSVLRPIVTGRSGRQNE